jgi:hypothetical protein
LGNQYCNNFTISVYNKVGLPVDDALIMWSLKKLSYGKVAEITGMKVGTVYKYCRRFGVSLSGKVCINSGEKKDQFWSMFRKSELNKANALSRRWVFI